MDQRIKELATASGLGDRWNSTEEFESFLDRFARSVVTESIGVVQKRFMGDLNREDMEVRRCVEDLKKHFGVE